MVFCGAGTAAEENTEERFGWHGQSTYIWQTKPAFGAAYDGINSLQAAREKSYSFTATLALGARLWAGGEAYLNGELVQGVALSGLTGLGGLSNGELQKTAGSKPLLYLARAFVRQTWALSGSGDSGDSGHSGDEREAVASAFNQLGGTQAKRRVVMSVGNLAVSDLFDNNSYAHEARTQFLNWALLGHGHFDFAADSRGYSVGAALEWITPDGALRAGRFAVTRESNGLALDSQIGKHFGDQLELEHEIELGGREGRLRLLAFRNVAVMARFDEALAADATSGGTPNLDAVRRTQNKIGWGLGWEQSLTDTLGGMLRLGRHDGHTEPYAFASIDDSASAALVQRGAAWQRPEDQLGLALVSNGLSAPHQRFLAAGGNDFYIGDGRLRYRRERVVEAYYSAALSAGLRLSADVQHITNPAYNRDRGPVRLLALRLHVEL